MTSLKERFAELNPVTCILIICFGSSTWVDLESVWVEYPLFVQHLPEGWSLPSVLGFTGQCSCVCLLIYASAVKLCPEKMHGKQVLSVYVIISVGAICCVLMAFFWDRTLVVAGEARSVALILLTAFIYMADTTSAVVFYPYMSRFKPHYMPYYIAGDEMGGMIVGFLGLAQGVGSDVKCVNTSRIIFNETSGYNQTESFLEPVMDEPRFSVSVFFGIIATFICVSLVAFSLLNFSPLGRNEMIVNLEREKHELSTEKKEDEIVNSQLLLDVNAQMDGDNGHMRMTEIEDVNAQMNGDSSHVRMTETEDADAQMNGDKVHINTTDTHMPVTGSKSHRKAILTAIMSTVGSMMTYGLSPSLQSFACLPYGTLAYTLAIRLSSIINPLAAVAAFFVPTTSLPVIATCFGVNVLAVLYLFVFALFSPFPPLHDHVAGAVIVVTAVVISNGTAAYNRATIPNTLREELGGKGLFYAGITMQIGLFFGGILGFILVNVCQIFESITPCA